MKSTILLATSAAVFGISLPTLKSFDWHAALWVGAIVAAGAVIAIKVVIAAPLVTTLAVSAAIGAIGGAAAGLYFGRQRDITRQEQIKSITRVSTRLDIYFEPSTDPKQAAPFKCTLVVYEQTDLGSRQPTVTHNKISAADSEEFYGLVDQQMRNWFNRRFAGDADGRPRRVMIYMDPYPGEGVYDRIRQLAGENGVRRCLVTRVDGTWKSALRQ